MTHESIEITPSVKRKAKRSLSVRHLPLADPQIQRKALHELELGTEFEQKMKQAELWPLRAQSIETLQINLGKVCNQTCQHCHVDAGPDRKESMSREIAEHCVRAVRSYKIPIVDITGGAPELNPNFRWLVEACTQAGAHVIDRCNLTILETQAHRDLPEFLAQHGVEIVCSLPHYRESDTDEQRGEGVYVKSIRALKRLNSLGYGQPETELKLTLVTNPVGAHLPAPQACLELEWKRELKRIHGIVFNQLYTITNMPISRYLEWLGETGNLEGYMQTLTQAFNPCAASGVMCRSMLSVCWDGTLYDCDFNQMLEIPLLESESTHIRDFDPTFLAKRRIATDQHCFGCTAGSGSSCSGATT